MEIISFTWRFLYAFLQRNMIIQRLRLVQFRNYTQTEFVPLEGVTVFFGENAQGKTNLIEAVHLCCLGRSHRTPRDAELVKFGEAVAQVTTTVQRRDGPRDVSVRIEPSGKHSKQIKINNSPVQRIGELMGHVNMVLFSPEDLRLIKDGPEVRRRFMDMEISQMRPAYFYALQRYARALAQRNELLRNLAVSISTSQLGSLDAWDALLAELGGEIIARRKEYLAKLAVIARDIHATISGGKEQLMLSYMAKANDSQEIFRLLHASRTEDIRRKSTGIGPHRDDMHVLLNGCRARSYASQGQQRTAVLAIKLAEIEVLREATGESPILLLDDVMSELDVTRREMLGERIASVQTLITCTHVSDLGGAAYGAMYRIHGGEIGNGPM